MTHPLRPVLRVGERTTLQFHRIATMSLQMSAMRCAPVRMSTWASFDWDGHRCDAQAIDHATVCVYADVETSLQALQFGYI